MSTPNKAEAHVLGLMPTVPVRDGQRPFERNPNPRIAQTTGTNVTAEFAVYRAERPSVVKKGLISSEVALTSDNTNFATLLLFKRTAVTPGTAITFLTANTKTTASGGTGNLTAWLSADVSAFFDNDITKRTLEANDLVTASVTKAGSGVTFGPALIEVLAEELSD